MRIPKTRNFWVVITAVSGAILVLIFLVLTALSDFDLADKETLDIEFTHGETVLHGSLIIADHTGPIVVFVHGDGPQDRFAAGGYLPMINAFLDAGISVFSWDKPGVGDSGGNWLDQSMQERAQEAAAAVTALREVSNIGSRQIGLLGFSQAGWVLPRVPELMPDLSFLVIVGGAVTWREQGAYYTRQRLMAEGVSEVEIRKIIDKQAAQNARYFERNMSYESYIKAENKLGTKPKDVLSADRFGFIHRNIDTDIRPLLDTLTLRVLTMSGAQDLNVDTDESVQTYNETLGGKNPLTRVLKIAGATHGLLDARYFNYQMTDQWPYHIYLGFLLSGRKAYATDVLEYLSNWILDPSKKTPR